MPIVSIKPDDVQVELPVGWKLSSVEDVTSSSMQFGCRLGDCGVCLIQVLEGGGNLNVPNTREENYLEMMGLESREYRLACQCILSGDVVIAPFGAV